MTLTGFAVIISDIAAHNDRQKGKGLQAEI